MLGKPPVGKRLTRYEITGHYFYVLADGAAVGTYIHLARAEILAATAALSQGRPLLWLVHQGRCLEAKCLVGVVVATDDEHLTGTDRVAECLPASPWARKPKRHTRIQRRRVGHQWIGGRPGRTRIRGPYMRRRALHLGVSASSQTRVFDIGVHVVDLGVVTHTHRDQGWRTAVEHSGHTRVQAGRQSSSLAAGEDPGRAGEPLTGRETPELAPAEVLLEGSDCGEPASASRPANRHRPHSAATPLHPRCGALSWTLTDSSHTGTGATGELDPLFKKGDSHAH
ncbi:hypothetical protein [Streptomyces sp. CB03238]|uniref:hypothetical protein n=1 Tax=Streptomyces sp. CB03238 TaxID=1907777 RepID=UPI000A10E2EE|nr:hypothetical protein [Streptomyces sp. CB03238]ORT60711.1 hypothetical protein BKD26_05665 [Streptomyces sp. CB03238]